MYQERDNSAPARAYEAEDPQPRELDQAFVEAMAGAARGKRTTRS
jgi:hypothetical protein